MAKISLEVHGVEWGAEFLRKKPSKQQCSFFVVKISLKVHGVVCSRELNS